MPAFSAKFSCAATRHKVGAPPFRHFFLLSALFPGATFACAGGAGTLNIPLFVVAFIVAVIAITILTITFWLAQKLLVNQTAPGRSLWSNTLLASAVITSFMLGAVGTFALPAFSNLYTSFGVELHTPTQILISTKHALWLPAILLLLSTRASSRRFHHTRFLATFLIGEAFLLLLVLWALYLPVFVLGCG